MYGAEKCFVMEFKYCFVEKQRQENNMSIYVHDPSIQHLNYAMFVIFRGSVEENLIFQIVFKGANAWLRAPTEFLANYADQS